MSIAILTGASAGLGQSFFKSLIARHPDLDSIWLIARRRERLEQMADGCPVPVTVLPLDLVDAASYDALADKLKTENVKVKILINNAGLGELDNVADSTWPVQSRMVDLNCRALTAVTTVVLPFMERGGYVLNVCSIASFCPNTRMCLFITIKLCHRINSYSILSCPILKVCCYIKNNCISCNYIMCFMHFPTNTTIILNIIKYHILNVVSFFVIFNIIFN